MPLIQIKEGRYISFDMPAHKKFLESIGFKKFSNYGWRVLNNHLKQIHTNNKYLRKTQIPKMITYAKKAMQEHYQN